MTSSVLERFLQALRPHPNSPTNFARGCLVNKAHAIAVQEVSPVGETDWSTANRSGSVATGDDRSLSIFRGPRPPAFHLPVRRVARTGEGEGSNAAGIAGWGSQPSHPKSQLAPISALSPIFPLDN